MPTKAKSEKQLIRRAKDALTRLRGHYGAGLTDGDRMVFDDALALLERREAAASDQLLAEIVERAVSGAPKKREFKRIKT